MSEPGFSSATSSAGGAAATPAYGRGAAGGGAPDAAPEAGFGARLREAMDQRGPLCVGIDPHATLLERWGLPDSAYGLERFSMACVEALGDLLGIVKPQSAFYERHGSAGVAVLERTIAAAREAGAVVILDAKRGDIGSTAAAYADAYLDPASPLCADAVTVSPYLGFGSLDPFIDTAARFGRGVFVLVLTSNPEGAEVQRARAGGMTVAGSVLEDIALTNEDVRPWGSVGAVVGATLTAAEEDLDINGPILAPGYGVQGGTADDLVRIFKDLVGNVIPSTSRGVLSAGPDRAGLRAAVERAHEDLRRLTG